MIESFPNRANTIKTQLFSDFMSSLSGTSTGYEILAQYQKDPVGFGKDVLNHTYPEQVQELFSAILEHEVVVAQSANAVGKSFGVADLAIWWYKCFPNSEVYITAAPPEKNLRRILWDKVTSGIRNAPEVFQDPIMSGMTIKSGDRTPRSTIDGVSVPGQGQEHKREASFSGKHAPYLLFIVDEADAVPDAVFNGIESCLSGGFVRLVCMFNPRHKQGYVYNLIRDHGAKVVKLSAFDHPNVVTGEDLFPGAVTKEKTCWRINKWCRYIRPEDDAFGPDVFTLPDFLVGYVAKRKDGTFYPPLRPGNYRIENPQFFYMVLGEYPTREESVLIEEQWVDAAVERWRDYCESRDSTPPEDTKCIIGIDPGELGQDKTVLCRRYGAFVEGFSQWGGVDIGITAERSEDEFRLANAEVAYIDANGFGAGVAPALRRVGINAVGVKTQVAATEHCDDGEFAIMRDQLLWQVRTFLKDNPASMLPEDEELREELLILRFHDNKRGKIKMTDKDSIRDKLKRSCNKLDALALTFSPKKGYTGDSMNDKRHQELKEKYCAPIGAYRVR